MITFDQSQASILTSDQSQVLRLESGSHMMGPGPGVMEPDENFCLRWNDYEKKYAETFRTLREDDHFAGELITLKCKKIVLKNNIPLCRRDPGV